MTNLQPFCEPYWHSRPSPYYNESHKKFQQLLRKFVNNEILPYINQWDEAGKYPSELRKKAYEVGIYGAMWDKEYGGTKPDNYDFFHALIWHDELARAGSGGLMASCFLPVGWALPPILKYKLACPILHKKICTEVISGEKTICLAITEPVAGSDVSNIQTTCIIDPNDNDYFLINGEKYFISNGINADYITCAVRTDKKSLSLILLDTKFHNGIYRSRMKTQGWWLGATTYITLKNVRVHKKYLIGKINEGFVPILENFNHGRFAMCVTSCRYARICLEDAIQWAKQRETFGKRLIEHQVIRHKIMEMARQIEACYALIEYATYLLKNNVSQKDISALMAMNKILAAKTMEFCAREASQILGARSYKRQGFASRIERIYREVTVMGIAEGGTEVLNDLIAKQAKL